MSYYEGMFIIKPEQDKELKKKITDFISTTITKEGGAINDLSEWAKRRLAYKIKKRTEGLYILTHFKLDSAKLEKIQKTYALNEGILKTLIVKNKERLANSV